MSELFISHSSRDGAASRELQERLKAEGHESVFLDFDPAQGIPAGESWERTLYTNLRACRAVVALCSKNYLGSHWCFAEVALARMEGKDLFVLQIEPWNDEDTEDEKKTEMPSILTEHQYIDLRKDREAGYDRLWKGFEAKGIVPSKHRTWNLDRSPYPGLRAFDEEDAPIFFGRDKETRQGVELLNSVRRQGQPRMVMVLGSSGSGKSSLTRAGILPELRRDEKDWLVVGPIRPGAHPGRELAAAFARAGLERPREEIRRRLEPPSRAPRPDAAEAAADDAAATPERARQRLLEALTTMAGELTAADRGVAESVERLREFLGAAPEARSPEGGRGGPEDGNPVAELAEELRLGSESPEASVLIVVDQFEELLGHDDDEDHPANAFLRMLRAGIEVEDHPPLVLGTMRSDFLGLLQRSVPLRGAGFKSLSVGPMTRDGMREIIEKPAALGKIQLEAGPPGLTDRLLDDTGSSDALPLLAFVLRLMWERYRKDRLLQIREYEALGGLEGAIAKAANEILEATVGQGEPALTEEELRDAFLRLARPAAEGSGWARQPARREEFPERVLPALELFEKQRLLRSRADGSLEVAHEALFRSWNKLRGWLDESAEALHLREEIQVESANWGAREDEKDRADFLLRGGRLARAVELRDSGVLALEAADREFIAVSERTEKARRRRKIRVAYSIAALVGAAALVALAMFFVAREQRIRAQDQALVAVASDWMDRDPTRAALVLLELRKPGKTAHAVSLMGEALGERLAVVEMAGHEDAINSAAFSPGGGRIVTASRDRTARLWNADGTPVSRADAGGPLELRHDSEVTAAAFSPGGELIVTAESDGEIRVWNADGTPRDGAGGEAVVIRHPLPEAPPGETPPPPEEVNWVAFAPRDERGRFVTASNDGTARLWTPDGEPVRDVRGGQDRDGKEPPIVLDHGDAEANFAAFSRDGKSIVTSTNRGDVLVWRADDGGSIRSWKGVEVEEDSSGACPPPGGAGHSDSVLRAAFDPAGRRIVTASRDCTARIWDLAPGAEPPRPPVVLPHPDQVLAAAFDPAGARVATASRDGLARVWELPESGEPKLFAELLHAGEVNEVAFSETGDRLLTSCKDGTARLWSFARSEEPMVKHDYVESAFFGPDGRRVATAASGGDKAVRVWSVADGSQVAELPHPEGVLAAAFDPAGERIVTGSKDGRARIWSADGGADPIVLQHDGAVHAVAFDPAGARIVTASADKTARVWKVDGTAVLRRANGGHVEKVHPDAVLAAAFSPRGDRILSLSGDQSAWLWGVDGGEAVELGAAGEVTAAAFDPSKGRIVTASGKVARVWKADGGPLLGAGGEPVELVHDDPVADAAFNRDGSLVVTAAGNSGWVWSADGRGAPRRLRGHEHPVVAVAFSPVDDRVVTAAKDKTARVWSADGRGDPLVLGGHPSWVVAAAFDLEGERVVTVADDYDARVWRVSYGLLGAAIRSLTTVCLSPVFRATTLGEDWETARERSGDCRACLGGFERPSAEAFDDYRNCVLSAR